MIADTFRVEIKIDLKNPAEEIFTHELDGVLRHFPIRAMRQMAEQYGGKVREIIATQANVVKKTARHIKENMGIEKWRLKRLCEPYLDEPIIMVRWESGEHTIIDGNHRYVKYHWLNRAFIKAYIFLPEAWKPFLLDLPGHGVLNKPSGMDKYDQWRKDNPDAKYQIREIA